ncbi:hypothetical protein PC116_g28093 [Phytophthora cactorum]|nr:hypothetical protein PC116_g28093 [Phytophthora cactorum]
MAFLLAEPPPWLSYFPCEAGGEKADSTTSIVMAIASSIDLNTLDNLSRTCRQVHQALLQYRSSILAHTLHCVNEDVPVDPEDTFRYRARAGNWYYMEDGRTGDYNGKSGNCARDMVAECRRCGTVVCRVSISYSINECLMHHSSNASNKTRARTAPSSHRHPRCFATDIADYASRAVRLRWEASSSRRYLPTLS